MKLAIYGSLGIAEHVIEALKKRDDLSIVIVVDEKDREGKAILDFTVQSVKRLRDISFDKIVIATMDFARALKQVYNLGYSANQLCKEVFWDPFFLQLEPTTCCNFSCPTCSRKDLPKERKNKNLQLADFKRILQKNPLLKRIQLQGLGEPLMNPELPTMLKLSHKNGISTSITTNASLLNCKLIKKIDPYVNKWVISVDAVEDHLFTQMRSGGHWQKIKQNIETLINSSIQSKIVFNCVISNQSQDEIKDILNYTLYVKPGEIHIQMAENWYVPKQIKFKKTHEYSKTICQKEKKILNQLSQWEESLKAEGIRLTYSGCDKRKGFCWWPYYGMFVSVDGYVTPCCIRMQPDVIQLGNLIKHSMTEIWNGKSYQELRESMYWDDSNDLCDFCPL